MVGTSTKVLVAGKEYTIQFYEADPGNLVIEICDKVLGCTVDQIKMNCNVFFELLINAIY
jgi:hypothetical protein